MSGHRRVKDIDYDEDDDYYSGDEDYGYEGEGGDAGADELSAEDKEQMRLGTISVREALGDEYASVTDAAIQEALWHYYYDVGKSVTYLKNQKQQAQPKKQKQQSKFDQAATSAAQKPIDVKKVPTTSLPQPLAWNNHQPKADWFKDIPWMDLPAERAGNIMVEVARPPLRLLGGTGKPSKLAALAAARKKKEAEQKAAQDAANGQPDKPAGAVSLLDRLGTKGIQSAQQQSADQENAKPTDIKQTTSRTFPIRKRKSPSPPPPVEERRPSPPQPTAPEPIVRPTQDLRAAPSIFASTMCGNSSRRRASHQETSRFSENILPALYDKDPNLANTNAFSGPSPDDIVIQAQAKGSTRS